MNTNFFYPSSDHVIRLHSSVMEITNQENRSIFPDKDINQTTEHVQNDYYYPDIFSKLSYYMFSILMNHYFYDGNKRTALATVKLFMNLNGIIYDPNMFSETIEHIIMMTASSIVDKEFLQKYFEMIISGVPDETVQLKIFNYLSNSDS
jgi:death on curing protein